MTNREIEISFIIDHDKITEILEILRKTGHKHRFVLKERESQFFSDYYFDNENFDLGRKKIALRMRLFNNKSVKIAIKKAESEDKWFSERLEIEDYFSENIFNSIIHFLNRNGLKFGQGSLEKLDGIKTKDQNLIRHILGLNVIQKRNTTRRSINFYKDSEILYEFAFDDTSFLFQNKTVKCNFMEIESKSDKNTTQNNNELVFSMIKNNYNDLFRVWKFNKLISGLAIDELFSRNKLTSEHIDKNFFLKKTAIDIIEKYLQNAML
ncbi:MAG: hypothetical protein DA328_03670 [Nitrososphaeraceae archaeon]|nr:hypothetical protein [Nitrososphaeraceae archaeon]